MLLLEFHKHRFTVLLISLLAFLLVAPLLVSVLQSIGTLVGRLLIFGFSTVSLAAATFAMVGNHRTVRIAFLLLVPSLLIEFLSTFYSLNSAFFLSHLLRILFLGFIILEILRIIFRTTIISFDTICGSLCVYLLFGALWSNLYSVADLITPGAIMNMTVSGGPVISEVERSFDMLYFSFVTLSTVGYGDLVPKTTLARMFAVAEAVIGQLYLLVMVSRLVGVQVAQNMNVNNTPHKPSP